FQPCIEAPLQKGQGDHTSVAWLRLMIMGAQYRFSLIYVLGLLTFVAGAIVIFMACLAMAGWIFGFGVFNLQFSNQSGHHGPTPLGMTPDAALCFILCGIALWMLRKATGKMAGMKAPAEKFLVEAALIRASLIKVSDEDSEKLYEAGPGGTEDETELGELGKNGFSRGFSRRLAKLCASVVAAIAVVVLAGYMFGW